MSVAGFKGVDNVLLFQRFILQRQDCRYGCLRIIARRNSIIQSFDIQYRFFGNKYGTLDLVLQFTHIARPRVGEHSALGIVRKAACLPFQFFRVAFAEEFSQRLQTFPTGRPVWHISPLAGSWGLSGGKVSFPCGAIPGARCRHLPAGARPRVMPVIVIYP